MLLNVYTMCVSLERNHHQIGQQNGQQHAELLLQMRHKKLNGTNVKKSESITNIANTNLLEVIQKEPKFFDEFECKYIHDVWFSNYIIVIVIVFSSSPEHFLILIE